MRKLFITNVSFRRTDLLELMFQKLLDETTSRVVCASPLLYNEGYGGSMLASQSSSTVSTSSISSMMSGMVDEGVVIFITHQSALVVMFFGRLLIYYCSLYYYLSVSESCGFHILRRQKSFPLWKYMLKFPNLMASGRDPCHMLPGDVGLGRSLHPLVCVNEVW